MLCLLTSNVTDVMSEKGNRFVTLRQEMELSQNYYYGGKTKRQLDLIYSVVQHGHKKAKGRGPI